MSEEIRKDYATEFDTWAQQGRCANFLKFIDEQLTTFEGSQFFKKRFLYFKDLLRTIEKTAYSNPNPYFQLLYVLIAPNEVLKEHQVQLLIENQELHQQYPKLMKNVQYIKDSNFFYALSLCMGSQRTSQHTHRSRA